MYKRVIFTLAIILISVSSLRSQLKDGDNLLGPSLGFWTTPNVPTFGLNYEGQFHKLRTTSHILNDGEISIL